MPSRVVTPPDPIVLPEEIAGDYDAAVVTACIQAATEQIDGPDGRLGRAFGPQTIEFTMNCWGPSPVRLPCIPIIAIDSISYVDADGIVQALDQTEWDWTSDGRVVFRSSPQLGDTAAPVQIVYQAGYDDEVTGPIPERARQAVILMVQDMLRLTSNRAGVRSETVEGIGSKTYLDQDRSTILVNQAVENLLTGLRVYSL